MRFSFKSSIVTVQSNSLKTSDVGPIAALIHIQSEVTDYASVQCRSISTVADTRFHLLSLPSFNSFKIYRDSRVISSFKVKRQTL